MKNQNILKTEGYFEVFLILFLITFFLYLIKSFILPIFLASIFVFFTFNFYNKLVLKTKSKSISALFVLFLVLTMILLPLFFLTSNLIVQTSGLVNSGINLANNVNFENCHYSFCQKIEKNIKTVNMNVDKIFIYLENYISKSASNIFNSVSSIILNLFIFILAFFFLLKDGYKFIYFVKRIIPMKTEYKNALFLRFKDVSEAIFINTIFVAIIQGTLLGIIFNLLGIKSAIFWGVVTSFFALLPMIGTAFVWIPAVIYFFLISNYWFAFLMIIGGLFVGTIDNVIRPFLLKNKISVHPFLIMISIFGGLEIFGFFGIFVGPIIISMLISVLQLYKLDFN